jgi:Mrp family chromosome partitioning ATPase
VRRALRAAAERGSPLIGVVENMAGAEFSGDAGDALAREFNVPLLARVPFHPGVSVWDALARSV